MNNNNIYIYECNDTDNIDELIDYFNNYLVIRPNA